MTRRNIELILLCVAAPLVVLPFAMLALNDGQALTMNTLGVPLGIFVAFVLAHLSVRKFAPGADPDKAGPVRRMVGIRMSPWRGLPHFPVAARSAFSNDDALFPQRCKRSFRLPHAYLELVGDLSRAHLGIALHQCEDAFLRFAQLITDMITDVSRAHSRNAMLEIVS